MHEMEKAGYSKNENKCNTVEKTKLEDLDYLQKQSIPGPLTTSEKVTEYMESEPESKEKNERMYKEIRFQRNSSQALKKDAAVFRLKRNSRNLETCEYAANLSVYLDQSRSMTSLTLNDLRNVLTGLNSLSPDLVTDDVTNEGEGEQESDQVNDESLLQPQILSTNQSFEFGEHVACFWYDDNESKYKWYLGVVDGINGEKVKVSYMKRSDRKGLNWLFPEEAEINDTNTDQILMRHIQVKYTLTAMIRCVIPHNTLDLILECFSKIQ